MNRKRKSGSELFEKASNGDFQAKSQLWDKGMEQGDAMALIELSVLQGMATHESLDEFLEEIADLEEDDEFLF